MKKMMKRLVILVCVLSMVMASAVPTAAASRKRLNKTNVVVTSGFTTTLKAYGGKAKWSSSNKNVASVNSSGKVTGRRAGTAVITAKIGSTKLKCSVTVKSNVFDAIVDWENAYICTNESPYQVKATFDELWYDGNGKMHARLLVKNSTDGKAYTIHSMIVTIVDENDEIIAKDFFKGPEVINGKDMKGYELTFQNSTRKMVDLTKHPGLSYSIHTY